MLVSISENVVSLHIYNSLLVVIVKATPENKNTKDIQVLSLSCGMSLPTLREIYDK